MTSKEAIARIENHKIVHKMNEPRAIYISEALDMAIKVLEQESCEDAISRQAVLDRIIESIETYHNQYTTDMLNMWGLFTQFIKEMPPVKPQEQKTGWIPVSERLPEDGRPVLIYAWNVHHVIARYDEFRTANGYKKTWVTADAWNGNTEINHEVIAWMPLPSPFEPQESEVSE